MWWKDLKGVWGWKSGVRILRIVSSETLETGKKLSSGKISE